MIYSVAIIVFILSFVFWLGTRWTFKHESDRRNSYQSSGSKNVFLIVEFVLVVMVCGLWASELVNG